MEAFLIVQRGEDIGRRFDIDTTQLTVGRGGDNDLVLNDPMVSRYHAVVKRQGSRFSLIDLGSSNPVVVNDQVCEPGMPQQLTHRDVVFIGKTVFSFQNRAAGAGPAPGNRPAMSTPTPARSDVDATQMVGGREMGGREMGGRDMDSPTPPPPSRGGPPPSSGGMNEDKTMIAPAPGGMSGAETVVGPPPTSMGGDDDKTMIVGGDRMTPAPSPFSAPPPPPAPIQFDDEETRTSPVVSGGPGAPPPPPLFGAPPPPPGDRIVGTPPNEDEGDLPTQIIPRR